MVQTTNVGGLDIPVETLEELLDKFDRGAVDEGSGAGVVATGPDGDILTLVDDGDRDAAVRVENITTGVNSGYTYVDTLEERLQEAQEPDLEPGTYLRLNTDASSEDFGAILPAGADFELDQKAEDSTYEALAFWHSDDDLTDLTTQRLDDRQPAGMPTQFDAGANITGIELFQVR